MPEQNSYQLFALGETALVIDFGNIIDEEKNRQVHQLYYKLTKNPFPGMIEAVPAYSSLTIFYDILFIQKKFNPASSVFEWVKNSIVTFLSEDLKIETKISGSVRIPVCYDLQFGKDLPSIAEKNKLSLEEIIKLHTDKSYRVYMLGFIPGFPYMAAVDERIASPRKKEPVMVEAGSVGIAGRQTGIYPFNSPGGWQIIGQTPIRLFNKDEREVTLFKPGDLVSFYSITIDEFKNIKDRNI